MLQIIHERYGTVWRSLAQFVILLQHIFCFTCHNDIYPNQYMHTQYII